MYTFIRKAKAYFEKRAMLKHREKCSHYRVIRKNYEDKGEAIEINLCLDCGILRKSVRESYGYGELAYTYFVEVETSGKPILRFHEYSGTYELMGITGEGVKDDL